MRASLPAGSFSPFDFEKEFQTRHGVRPEDVDKSWHISYSSRESMMSTISSTQETGPLRTEIPPSTTSSRDTEVIRTPSVARDQEYAKKKTYAGNTVTLDTRLLQDILSGSWARQQLYGSTPSWYCDSFYNIVQPWERWPEEYEVSIGQQPTSTLGNHPRLPLIGPPSDISSVDRPPSTVGPSVSVCETTTPRRKVNFSVSHYAEGLSKESPKRMLKQTICQPHRSETPYNLMEEDRHMTQHL